jgi:hypothetical protein
MATRARRTAYRLKVEDLERREAPTGVGLTPIGYPALDHATTGDGAASPAETLTVTTFQKVREA